MARPWTLRRLRTPLIVLVIILVFGRLTGILSRHVILGLLNRQNTAYLPRLEYAKRTEAQIILDDLAGNSTLGFGAIHALSKGTEWRVSGLTAAANYTGLEVQIPYQRPVPEADIDYLKERANIRRGSALAYFAHVNALRDINDKGPGTVLIMEDDVDFDVRVRQQAIRTARAVRRFTHVHDQVAMYDESPYGTEWDILWLGHCRDIWHLGMKMLYFEDDTVVPHSKYVGDSAGDNFLNYVPSGHRAVVTSSRPTCTFAYAVNKAAINEILWRFEDMIKRGVVGPKNLALDVFLLVACQNKLLRCYTVSPELMTQYLPPEEAGISSEIAKENANARAGAAAHQSGAHPKKKDGSEFSRMGSTPNIARSARCKALFDRTCLADRVAREY